MKRFLIFSLIFCLSGLLTTGCERGVRAGREGEPETYQPRPAPIQKQTSRAMAQPMTGELLRVDRKAKTITVRAENGMEQTFKINNAIRVQQLRDLRKKEGSLVAITWVDEAGTWTATSIDVK